MAFGTSLSLPLLWCAMTLFVSGSNLYQVPVGVADSEWTLIIANITLDNPSWLGVTDTPPVAYVPRFNVEILNVRLSSVLGKTCVVVAMLYSKRDDSNG